MPKAFLDLIEERQSFLLSGHEHPDGDCLGAQVGLYHLLEAKGKKVAILNPDPVSRAYDFLLQHTPIEADSAGREVPECEVAVLLDCAQLTRLGALGEKVRSAGCMVAVVDHHVDSASGDGEVAFIDSSAAATGILVYRLYRELDLPISRAAAEGIFLSLVADTGWFRYSNADAEVFAAAAQLVEIGVQPSELFDRMYRRNHAESVDLLQQVLGTHRLMFDGKYGYACLDKAAMAQAAKIDFDTDAVMEPLRCIDGIEVVALFKERFDGGVKLSLRASGDIDVRRIAAEFGGGGHVKAAGATLEWPMGKSVELVQARVRRALEAAGEVS